jgi:hypothetical protein
MQPRNVILNARAHQRLSTSNPYLPNPEAQKYARKPVQLRPGKNFVVIAVIFGIGRAAINAPEVATVRDRNPQVGDLPAKFIEKGHRMLFRLDATA